MNAHSVARWRNRFIEGGFDAIAKNRPRGATMNGSRSASHAKLRQRIIEITTTEKPPGETHWSTRTLAAKLGTNAMFVSRVWRDNGLKPHLVKSFKVSNDPKFEEKLTDVVGLYLNPPDNAAVFCVDEKSSIQALDRTQPGLPLKKGRAGTMTHDYKRNGTSTFYTHKHQKVKNWLKRNKRVTLHFIPTSSSWLNLVERFFGLITDKAIRRGVFSSVKDLEEKLMQFIVHHSQNPKPFVWTKSVEVILEKVVRAKAELI